MTDLDQARKKADWQPLLHEDTARADQKTGGVQTRVRAECLSKSARSGSKFNGKWASMRSA
jgi:hypothetical protein